MQAPPSSRQNQDDTSRPLPRCFRSRTVPAFPQSTTKLIRMLTRHSLMVPLSFVTTLISLIQAPLMFLTVADALPRPCFTASSIPFSDDALNSMILVTDMGTSVTDGHARHARTYVAVCGDRSKPGMENARSRSHKFARAPRVEVPGHRWPAPARTVDGSS